MLEQFRLAVQAAIDKMAASGALTEDHMRHWLSVSEDNPFGLYTQLDSLLRFYKVREMMRKRDCPFHEDRHEAEVFFAKIPQNTKS